MLAIPPLVVQLPTILPHQPKIITTGITTMQQVNLPAKVKNALRSPAAKRKIVAHLDENGTPLKKMKIKRVQPNRKNVKRSPGSNGMKGLCNKKKHLSFFTL